MTPNRSKSLLARIGSLFTGMFRLWVRDKEQENPQVVYEEAIRERKRQYGDLKQAVAGILYMRNKLEAEIEERRMEIARLHDDIRRAVRSGQDDLSITLIAHKQDLFEELERAEKELEGVRVEAAEAKNNLIKFREEIRSLLRERGRVLATLANVQARRRLQAALDGLSVDTEMAALENVREHVSKLSVEGQLDREVGDAGVRNRLRAFREEARTEAARAELEQLKREMAANLLPESARRVVVPVASS
jgi:phage shock protein A